MNGTNGYIVSGISVKIDMTFTKETPGYIEKKATVETESLIGAMDEIVEMSSKGFTHFQINGSYQESNLLKRKVRW